VVRNDTDKVPFLGDLPVLGHLFKKNSKSDVKTEMLIFLTPRILQEDLMSGR
jgi:type IV pilus assembly protein PilQ